MPEQGAFGLKPRRQGLGDSSVRPTTAQEVVIDQVICSNGLWVLLSTIASRPAGWLLTQSAVSVQEAYKRVRDLEEWQ